MSDPSPTEMCRGYAICAEARSGSTLLSQIAASTGELGHPHEYFAGIERVRAALKDRDSHLAQWMKATASPNVVYALKIFAHQFDLVEPTRWAEALPNLHFVHLERIDLLGQAISWVRAGQTGQFDISQGAAREPAYDAPAIAAALRALAQANARWRMWFARNGIRPLHLTYESVAADPERAAEAIASHIGIARTARVDEAKVAARIQRDGLSQEWRERFVRERSDLGYLDAGAWRLGPKLRRLRSRFW